MKLFDNLIIILVLIFVTIISGCGASVWSGPRGHGTSIAGISDVSSTAEYRTCLSDRERQRSVLLTEAGVLHTETPTTTSDTEMNYHEAIRIVCEGEEAREHSTPPQPRLYSAVVCAELLANTAATTPPPAPTPSVVVEADPFVRRTLLMNPALRQDDVAFCMNASSSYGAPSAGGYGSMYGSGMSSGCIPGIAGCGITPYGAY
jgi:hypothetical protein